MQSAGYPAQFHYSQEHEWVEVQGSSATVGITDHAQHQLGDIVFVDLPKVGDKVQAGKPCGSVESVKAVSEIFSPVTGEVTDVNGALVDHPEIVNQDPHGRGWMIKLALAAGGLPPALMTAEQYQELLRQEGC